MTKNRPDQFLLCCTLLCIVWGAFLGGAFADSPSLQLQARLIWGSNSGSPAKPSQREVDAQLSEKLRNVFKWNKYFEVERKAFTVPPTQEVKLSEDCTVHVKHLGDNKVEVRLFGKNRHMVTKRQSITRDESIVLAGDGKDGTAWFVVVTLASKK